MCIILNFIPEKIDTMCNDFSVPILDVGSEKILSESLKDNFK